MKDVKKNGNFVFSPRTVAVIGASTRENTVGRSIFTNMLFSGYTGIVYPVNPKARGILGVRAYRSVWDIPGEVDLAVIIVPSVAVPQVIEECGEKGVKAAIIITAGFKEVGEKGKELEKTVIEAAKKHSIPLIGPNCLGVINTDPEIGLNATFAASMPKPGNIAFISQSGALGVAALEYAYANNIGLSKFVSMGNKADLNENDMLEIIKDDPQTDVILLYIEDLSQPKRFIELAREITTKRKPMLAIKSGRTIEGAKAASSHTGALASSDEVYDSLFHQCGVLRVETFEEMFDYARAFANQPLPKGKRIAIVTNAGGPGIMATDACIRHGLELASFDEKTTLVLKAGLPQTANIHNPVDVIGDAREDRYKVAMEACLADENVDGVIVISTLQAMTSIKEISSVIGDVTAKHQIPVLVCYMGVTDISDALKTLDEKHIPHYKFPEAAARAMASMAEYSHWLTRKRTEVVVFTDIDKAKVEEILAVAKRENRRFLPEPLSHGILKAYGFPMIESKLSKNEEECLQSAQEIGYPVVMKIVSPDIIHKVDVGGVRVNIKNETELKEAYKEILESVKSIKPEAEIWGVFIQKMSPKGKETIIGMHKDQLFGDLLMFGLGGIYVEILRDVTFRIAPVRELGTHRMIEEIRSHKILEGFRGEKPSDIVAIAECLQRLSQLVTDFPEIEELDINPLVVFEEGKGAAVLDARILIA
ncbi:MAG: acetate--CoA ligase family protein [bacterium]|nr:acetate--CoA ligase family protein [bacterium]